MARDDQDPADEDETGPDAGDEDQPDEDDAGNDPADDPRPARPSSPAVVDDGAGWVLGLILWAGVVLPYLKHGPTGVKAWWLAKFLNKAPDGSYLP